MNILNKNKVKLNPENINNSISIERASEDYWLELSDKEVKIINWINQIHNLVTNSPVELKLDECDLVKDFLSGFIVNKILYDISNLTIHPNNLIAIKDIVYEGIKIERVLRACTSQPEL